MLSDFCISPFVGQRYKPAILTEGGVFRSVKAEKYIVSRKASDIYTHYKHLDLRIGDCRFR